MTVLLLLAAVGLVAVCGIFVAAEFAFITVNRSTVERLASRGDSRARGVQRGLKTLSTQLSGAQVGITVTNLAIGFLAEPTVAAVLYEPLQRLGVPAAAVSGIALFLAVLVATVVTMVFGELVPKNLAIARPLATAKFVQAPQRGFSWLMKYPIRLLNGSANFLLRRLNIEPQEELASARSADELSSLVRRSAEKGTLAKDTALMLERSLAFGELKALDVMTPRVRMRTVRADEPVAAVLTLARRSGLSRFPVVGKDLDDVVGIVHIKQVVAIAEADRRRVTVATIMHQPVIVPSSIPLDPLLETLRGGGLQMAILIDEFGGTDGIVTIEDLIEELVGEVRDEHDRTETAALRRRGPEAWALSGLLRPDEISQRLGILIPEEEEFETMGGLVADRLERVPAVKDAVTLTAMDQDGAACTVRLVVERMDGRRVDRILLQVTDRRHPETTE